MQKYKNQFVDQSLNGQTLCNIQSCIRMNDLESIGDGTHFGYFNMMGTFSFNSWSVQQTIDFWMEYLTKILQINVDYVTIHPDVPHWKEYHQSKVRYDSQCKWSDGEIGGYCTEFYVNDIEIGNIVNPLGTSIDVGFGLERLDFIVNKTEPKNKQECLIDVIKKIIDSGYVPSPKGQGYVLRRLIRSLFQTGGTINHPFFEQEKNRQLRMQEVYNKIVSKYSDKSKEWWYSTHGIDVDLL